MERNCSPREVYRRLLAAHPPRLAFARDPDQPVPQWQATLRAALLETLGRTPEPVPLKVEVADEEDLGDHRRQHLYLRTEAGFWLPAYLLLPKELSGPVPGVLAIHGHGPGKVHTAGMPRNEAEREKWQNDELDYGLQAVRQGYVALCPDLRAMGECDDPLHRHIPNHLPCPYFAGQTAMLGRTLLGERVWDVCRAVDFLLTRPEVDGGRIACIGHSGGATATLFAAAIEPRIGLAVASGYLCRWADSIYAMAHCACNYVPGLAALADCADIAGLIAPRPLLVVAGDGDGIFPLPGVRAAYEELAAIYRAAGSEGSLALSVNPGGHRFFQTDVWPFLRRWLG